MSYGTAYWILAFLSVEIHCPKRSPYDYIQVDLKLLFSDDIEH